MSSKPIFAFAAISLLGVGYFHPMFNQNLLDFLSTAPTLMSLKPISAVAVMITALLGVLYFESTFDKLHLYWIAGRIRKIKELFDSQDSLKAQTEWIERMKFHTLETYKQMQWLEYARSTVIRCGETGELDRVGKSDLRYWGSRLENGKLGLWAIEQRRYQHHLRKPQGPRIREYETNVHRRAKLLEQDPVKFISHPERVNDCRLSGGCCRRGCTCCLRPRAIYPDGSLFYSHCTAFCGCCINDRDFIVTVNTSKGKSVSTEGAKVLD